MMKIALFGSRFNAEDVSVLNVLLDKLQAGQSLVYFESRFFEILQEFPDIKSVNPSQTWTQLDSSFDLLITIGGDGTLLRAIKYLNGLEVPVVGINTGRLGFLATIPKKFLEQSIDDLLAKRFIISERCVLEISSNHPISGLMDNEIALNEITVSRKDTTAMVKIETLLNGEYLTSYWADGLIVSTPTGSTGYSLSCGGPIVMPQSNNLVLTPIAPHNLNVRPLVIPDHLEVTLTVSSRTEQFLV
jgi:NAD+ kinase